MAEDPTGIASKPTNSAAADPFDDAPQVSLPTVPSAALRPRSLKQLWWLAEKVANSEIAPKDYRGKPDNCFVSMQLALEVGLNPISGLSVIANINGRPSVFGDGALGIVRASGKMEIFTEWWTGEQANNGVLAEREPKRWKDDLTAWCLVKRKGDPKEIVWSFSLADAKRAGLWGKAGPWTEYPQRMMAMRPRSWCLRDGFADVLKGLSILEEAIDITPAPAGDDSARVKAATADTAAKLREKYGAKPAAPEPEREPGDEVEVVCDQCQGRGGRHMPDCPVTR